MTYLVLYVYGAAAAAFFVWAAYQGYTTNKEVKALNTPHWPPREVLESIEHSMESIERGFMLERRKQQRRKQTEAARKERIARWAAIRAPRPPT